ncbi:MAG: hypothetical protein PHN26_05580 [Eubacteriaceae bacterium]|nr:hypothetical protein [Eubacteriaceae bacterium]
MAEGRHEGDTQVYGEVVIAPAPSADDDNPDAESIDDNQENKDTAPATGYDSNNPVLEIFLIGAAFGLLGYSLKLLIQKDEE